MRQYTNKFTGQPRSSQAIRLAQARVMDLTSRKTTTGDRIIHDTLVATCNSGRNHWAVYLG